MKISFQKHTDGPHYLIKGMVTKLANSEHGLLQQFNECLKLDSILKLKYRFPSFLHSV